jgi:hypothetical protein
LELRSLTEFHAALRAGRVIVITDKATGVKAHRPDCSFVTDDNFTRKVIDGQGKNASYFAEPDLDEALRLHQAKRCSRCKP